MANDSWDHLGPFLCIITPVFDGALSSLKLLIEDLKKQSLQDFIHVLVSNGESSQIKELIQSNSKIIYVELPFEKTEESVTLLLANLGKRREYCLKNYRAKRFLFLDADIQVLDPDYFAKLLEADTQADILITQVTCRGTTYPTQMSFWNLGDFDISNYSFSFRAARTCNYPTDYAQETGLANDRRFYREISRKFPVAFLFFISAEKDGNNTYSTVSSVYRQEFVKR